MGITLWIQCALISFSCLLYLHSNGEYKLYYINITSDTQLTWLRYQMPVTLPDASYAMDHLGHPVA